VADNRLTTSSVGRFLKLGGLAGRVGMSMVGSKVADMVRSGPTRELRSAENLVRNAARIAETLGELKGAAMKVGQMLSLHEGLLPPEVAEVLRSLQKEAPRVPAEVMEDEIRGSLVNFDELFERLDFEAFAAASIGQVHLGRLRDGRSVAVKIQYPLIDHIVRADLDNLKRVIQTVISLVFEADVEAIWEEVRDRLLEELDYTREAANIRRMADLHAGVPEIVIPAVVDEATTRNVLTMELVEGANADDACSARFTQSQRDRWAVVMVDFVLRGLLEHRFLHADPNLANFAFLDDGRVVVYDFGCVKEISPALATGYAALLMAVTLGRHAEIPHILTTIGVSTIAGAPLSRELTDPWAEMLAPVARPEPPYTFGGEDLYRRLMEHGMSSWSRAADIQFPKDAIFVNRTLGGHFGNLNRLHATGPWRELILRYAGPVVGATTASTEPHSGP
jgi:predicted unusual protein kinase regulating ubiquinone biosynthesis (AarF/ABC1/UbiB family)